MVTLTKMVRGEMFADVHPDEVEHMKAHDWLIAEDVHSDGTPKVTYTEADAEAQAEVTKKKVNGTVRNKRN